MHASTLANINDAPRGSRSASSHTMSMSIVCDTVGSREHIRLATGNHLCMSVIVDDLFSPGDLTRGQMSEGSWFRAQDFEDVEFNPNVYISQHSRTVSSTLVYIVFIL